MFNRRIIAYLEEWKLKKTRKPLVLRGARQVGKTHAVKLFAQNNFTNFIYINLDRSEDRQIFGRIDSLSDFIKTVEVTLHQKLTPGDTLLFIDEIQNSPKLIELLRFFYEELPGLHVIVAGSLLEAVIEKSGLAMPVGRVEYAYMHPLTFFEFLEAGKNDELLKFLQELNPDDQIPLSIHELAKKLFHEYSLIGGMPEVVAAYYNKTQQVEINNIYSSLLTAYVDDVFKYSSSADVKYVQHIIEQAPYFAGEKITYEKFGNSSFRSREMSNAFSLVEKTMLTKQLLATSSLDVPVIAQSRWAKKLLFLDIGFINFKNNIQSQFIRLADLNGVYRGKVAEQIVGQNLLANNINIESPLYYWTRSQHGRSAEVDFCFLSKGKIVGVEVKSGNSVRLQSLFSFGDVVNNSLLIRVYDGQLKRDEFLFDGKKYKVLSLPLYLTNRIIDFI